MLGNIRFLLAFALAYLALPAVAGTHPSMAEILAAAKPTDWRPLDPDHTLYVELPAGRVIIELAPGFAPLHVANIKALARAGYYDGLPVLRVQDNYVAQWGDPDNRYPIPRGIGPLAPEFDSEIWPQMPFTPLPDGDVYASEVGFSGSFPAARSTQQHLAWLAHCYGMVGVGRDLDVRSGSGEMGFYSATETAVRIKSIRVAADLPPAQRSGLEVIRTDTPTFAALIESRRNRHDDFFKVPAGHIDLCNVPIAVREPAPPAPQSP